MMTTIPAVVAGVPRIVVITPPGPDGRVDDATLVAAHKAGVAEVYKCGGAQGVAAVTFGTATVPKVAKVIGPGSPYVLAAKRLLADRIAALDLVIESEHGPDSSAFLVTDTPAVADAAIAALPGIWVELGAERAAFSQAVLCGPRGGVVLARDMADAIAFVNDYAPEHLEVLSDDPFAYLGRIEHAGEILLGPHTPIVLGNFVLGPDCVLPTGGWARTFSPLSVFDFLKRSSIGYVTPGGLSGACAPRAHPRDLRRLRGPRPRDLAGPRRGVTADLRSPSAGPRPAAARPGDRGGGGRGGRSGAARPPALRLWRRDRCRRRSGT
jgi:histidinol dehydrogenase